MNDERPSTDPDVIETDWIGLSDVSHVKAVRFVNRAFVETGGPSELWVIFKSTTSKKTGITKPESTYRYESHDHLALRQTFEKMCIATHPGEIVWSDLIRPGVSYTPM